MSSARNRGGSSSNKRATHRSKSPDAISGVQQPGLRKIVQHRLLEDVFQSAAEKHEAWKILVVDDASMKVISSAVGMYDIMERKVTLVESLEKKRAPFPDMDALYVLAPTAESVDLLVADFKSKPLYGTSVFLYFLGRLPDNLFAKIKGCNKLLKRVKCLVEINIDFLATEERAFTFNMRDDLFPSLYLRRNAAPAELTIAEKLVTVCATLNEYPHIRFQNASALCNSLSSQFKIKMDEFVANNPDWWYHGGTKKNSAAKKERGTLLLLDRAEDCLSPLMHDFNYQAMVQDLLPMEGDRITYENDQGNKTDVLLDEKDRIWTELRGKHIAEVIETLSNRIKDIMNSSTGSALGGNKKSEGNLSLSEMASALKALPEYQEVMSKLSQHMHLSHQCMDKFTAGSLMNLAEIEQTLATGKNDEGRSQKTDDIMEQSEAAISKMTNTTDKIRLLLVATIACNGLRSQDKRRLTNAADLSGKELRLLNALETLGLQTVNEEKVKHVKGIPGREMEPDDESEFTSSRYAPAIRSILEAWAMDELSLDDFPSVTPMPPSASTKGGKDNRKNTSGAAASARKAGGASSRWGAASGGKSSNGGAAGPVNFNGPRCMVFMIGGMCYTEMNAAREISESSSREVIVGSTTFLSPTQFVEELAHLAAQQ